MLVCANCKQVTRVVFRSKRRGKRLSLCQPCYQYERTGARASKPLPEVQVPEAFR